MNQKAVYSFEAVLARLDRIEKTLEERAKADEADQKGDALVDKHQILLSGEMPIHRHGGHTRGVGDVGDGWNSTYAIAYHLAKEECELVDPQTGKTLQTKRGDLLIFGGDEVRDGPAVSEPRALGGRRPDAAGYADHDRLGTETDNQVRDTDAELTSSLYQRFPCIRFTSQSASDIVAEYRRIPSRIGPRPLSSTGGSNHDQIISLKRGHFLLQTLKKIIVKNAQGQL